MGAGKGMNKLRLILYGVITAVAALSTALLPMQPRGSSLSQAPTPPRTIGSSQSDLVEYKVGRVIRSSNKPYEVTVIISLEPEHFNRGKMIKLAKQLNQDFANVQLLRVEILDDPDIAENYVPAGDMYRVFYKAKRGTYQLDRNTHKERIKFSSARGKPMDAITIKY